MEENISPYETAFLRLLPRPSDASSSIWYFSQLQAQVKQRVHHTTRMNVMVEVHVDKIKIMFNRVLATEN